MSIINIEAPAAIRGTRGPNTKITTGLICRSCLSTASACAWQLDRLGFHSIVATIAASDDTQSCPLWAAGRRHEEETVRKRYLIDHHRYVDQLWFIPAMSFSPLSDVECFIYCNRVSSFLLCFLAVVTSCISYQSLPHRIVSKYRT